MIACLQMYKSSCISSSSFYCRTNVLGHAQQGGSPTPFDRNLGTKLAARALEYLVTQAKEAINLKTGVASATNADTATLLGLRVSCLPYLSIHYVL